ncbi:MAG: glycoside hydrolase family 57 protein [Burkholderiales bacterium]|nr:glycoside hydrolase family 57 protein [Burkholderiales bacterium]
MHQPEFRDVTTGRYRLPWTGLHALKDYTDMAAHLERHPQVRCVVNFVPVLLDQLEDYADQVTTGTLRDPLLALLARDETTPLSAAERDTTLAACFRGNAEKMIEPFAGYRRLRDMHRFAEAREMQPYLGDAYLRDLVTWYFLAWTGESVRRDHVLVSRLMRKGHGFTATDRGELYALVASLLRSLLGRWRRLADSGRVELSSTPYFHPIGPLLIDFDTAREKDPGLPLPNARCYPDGAARFDAHVAAALDSHARRFGRPPAGLWPAEGALSDATLAAFARHGVRWTASGQAVLAGSLPHADAHRGWRVGGAGPLCFFRDDRLSDLIGFEYSRWHGEEAAAHFLTELERIAEAAPDGAPPLVSVILDGENAWEYYPYNGWYFLDTLYARLETHPSIRTATCTDVLDHGLDRAGHLDRLVAGSWVHGTLTTWIGSPDKNRAWDLLCDAKRAHDRIVDAADAGLDAATRAAVAHQLSVCEGSDWFWWFGDYNPPEAVAEMDRVFRANLSRLYALLGLAAPPELDRPISHGATAHGAPVEAGGTMRRAS